ncbi:tetratricopeptide repeat protein [bacterium]|nr:tetratricopeptide repeat protein [bacterium]
MTKWRWAGIGLFAFMLGCTSMSTQNGDAFFAQNDYERAMQAYIRSLQVQTADGKRYIRYQPVAMTRIGISAMQLNMVDGAIKVFNFILRKTPDYGPAHFFLGVCYEKKGDLKKAQQIYAGYDRLPADDPSRDAMKGRLYAVREQMYSKEARLLAAKGPGPASEYPLDRIVVLDFRYGGSDLRGTIIAKGVASLIISDLDRMGGFQVIPRDKLMQLQKYMGWQSNESSQIENVEKIQRMMGAGSVLQGDMRLAGSGQLNFHQRTILFSGIRGVRESDVQGQLSDIVLLEKKMVVNLLKDLGIRLTDLQRTRLREPATRSVRAFFNYAYALHALDLGQYETAQLYLAKALEEDPAFAMAEQILAATDIFLAVQTPDLALLCKTMAKRLRYKSGGFGAESDYDALASAQSIDRLQQMGWYLDAGFIPGSDSRDPFEGIDFDDFTDLLPDGLPDPPDPPAPYPLDPWYLPDPPPPPHRP